MKKTPTHFAIKMLLVTLAAGSFSGCSAMRPIDDAALGAGGAFLGNLRLLDYTITVNVDPLPITQEISKEEKEHDRVAGDYASEKKISLLTVMEKKQKKIHALMQGQTIPFHAMCVNGYDKGK